MYTPFFLPFAFFASGWMAITKPFAESFLDNLRAVHAPTAEILRFPIERIRKSA